MPIHFVSDRANTGLPGMIVNDRSEKVYGGISIGNLLLDNDHRR